MWTLSVIPLRPVPARHCRSLRGETSFARRCASPSKECAAGCRPRASFCRSSRGWKDGAPGPHARRRGIRRHPHRTRGSTRGRSLPAIFAPQLRQALLRLSQNEKAKDLARRALAGLAGFAKALKVKFQDIEVGIDFDPEPGLADNGDLEHDLQALLEVVGAAAQTVVYGARPLRRRVAVRRGRRARGAHHGTSPYRPASCRRSCSSVQVLPQFTRTDGPRKVVCRAPVRFPGGWTAA